MSVNEDAVANISHSTLASARERDVKPGSRFSETRALASRSHHDNNGWHSLCLPRPQESLTLLQGSPNDIDASGTERPVIRVGLLVDSLVQPAWIASCLEEVVHRGDGTIALIVQNRSPSLPQSSSRIASWWRNRRYLAYALYTRLDGLRGVARDPFEPRSLAESLGDVPQLDVVPRETRFADYFEPDDVQRIRAYDLDVVVRFGFRILRGDALRIARYGVWSYHHGDNRMYRGGPAGFWEVMKGDPVTGSMLQRLSEDLDGGQVLFRAWAHTIPFSVRRNRAHYYWQSAPMLAWGLRDLRRHGESGLSGDTSDEDNPAAYSQRIFTAPSNKEMLGHGIRLVTRHLSQRVRSAVKAEQWFLAWHQERSSSDKNGWPNLAPFRFRAIVPPPDRFWADPFPYQAEGKTWVFFEEFVHGTEHPHIAVMEFGPNGPTSGATTVLSTDSRLSYPFVFGFEGNHFMMPETAARGCVQLWRAKRFPSEWVPDRVLIDERPLVDATMAFVEGRWWIWAVATTSGGVSWDELYLYHSDSPLGPWQPHLRNPVMADVRGARPAGRLFQHNGVWYRPAQDCSKSYGGALVIHRIERLDQQGYRERQVTRIDPQWAPGLVGAHTINATGGLTIMDVRRRHWRWER